MAPLKLMYSSFYVSYYIYQSNSFSAGTPGAPWTVEEQLIVKTKLIKYSAMRQAPKFLRLSFHDCLKYTDGTGGCDGCLNWRNMGNNNKDDKFSKKYPPVEKGDNNGLSPIVEELEKVYTKPDYPKGTPVLAKSLKELGKSRADLWALAGIKKSST